MIYENLIFMDKKYQVFVSSTYEDLKEERSEVIQALLESGCIPVGMELFPASDENQWSFIKSVIDNCDYYVIILGGRYGSCANDGIGYTEKEFLYAKQQNIPILAFLHEKPDELPGKNLEKISKLKKKYEAFRKTLISDDRLCRFWNNKDQLGKLVSISITRTIKTYPRTGWIRADKLINIPESQNIVSKTFEDSPYFVQSSDYLINYDTSGGNSIVELPEIGKVNVRWASGNNKLTVRVIKSGTINGESTRELRSLHDSLTLVAEDPGEWYLI